MRVSRPPTRSPSRPGRADPATPPGRGIRQERRIREAFAPDEVAPGELTRRIADVVNEVGLQRWRPPERLDPIEVDEVNLVVWMGVMEADT